MESSTDNDTRSALTSFWAIGTGLICILSVAWAGVAAAPAQETQLAEDVFLNVPDMGGVPVDEFMETMGMFSAALNLNCTDCHTSESSSSWEAFADETPIKRTTRRMIQMVSAINEQHFGGLPFVSCWTCHRGDLRPKVVPDLRVQYGVPLDDPNDVMFIPDPFLPEPEEIFDAYIEALGGEDRLAELTSYTATGAYMGFDTGFAEVPVEIYAQAPDRRATVVHPLAGDSVRTFDGSTAWVASTDKALMLMPLTADNLDGARTEAIQGFPLGLQETRDNWQVGFTFLNDVDVQVLQGTSPGTTPINLYFDDAGLLIRLLRFVDTPVGRIPTQIDFSDYREVAGVLMPFHWTSTWTNGQATIQLEDVQPNVPIDPARFGQPPPAEFR